MYNNHCDGASYNHHHNRAVFWRLLDSVNTAAQEYTHGGNQQRQSQTPEYTNQTIVSLQAPVPTYPQTSIVRPVPSYPYYRNTVPVDSMNTYDTSGLPPAAQAIYDVTYSQNPAFDVLTTRFHANATARTQCDAVRLIHRPQALHYDRRGHPYLSSDHSVSPSHTCSPAMSRSSLMTFETAVTATGHPPPENSFDEDPRYRAPWTSTIDAKYQSSPHLIPGTIETAAPEKQDCSSREPSADGMLKKMKKLKIHQCEICQHEFSRRSSLRDHMNSHNNIRPYGCPFPGCESAFVAQSNAKRHLRVHENFHSDDAGRADAKNLTSINPNQAPEIRLPMHTNPTMNSTWNLSVNYSPQRMSSFPYSMSEPERQYCSSPESPSDGTVQTKKKNLKMHRCEICQHKFPRPSGLRDHMNSHNNVRPYGCPFPGCEKTFGTRVIAKRHLRVHGNFHSDKAARADAKNPTCIIPSQATMIRLPMHDNLTMGSTWNPSANYRPQRMFSFPYSVSNAMTPYLPASLMSRSNVSQLCETTTMSSHSEYEQAAGDYNSSGNE